MNPSLEIQVPSQTLPFLKYLKEVANTITKDGETRYILTMKEVANYAKKSMIWTTSCLMNLKHLGIIEYTPGRPGFPTSIKFLKPSDCFVPGNIKFFWANAKGMRLLRGDEPAKRTRRKKQLEASVVSCQEEFKAKIADLKKEISQKTQELQELNWVLNILEHGLEDLAGIERLKLILGIAKNGKK